MNDKSDFSTCHAKLSSSSRIFCQAKGVILAWLSAVCIVIVGTHQDQSSLFIDEVLSENFLDYKNRGVNGSHRGQIIWKIDASSYFVERKYFSNSAMI